MEAAKKKKGFLKHSGKAASNIEANSFNALSKFDRQQTRYNMYQNMNQQIEQLPDDETNSIFTENISQFGGLSQAFENVQLNQ